MALREEYKKNGLPDESLLRPVETYGPVNGITIIDEDITLMDVDCIVNAANSTLLGGGGVDGAIHRVAGPELLAECRTLGGCRTGEAKITGGYRLKAKYIMHTVGPIYQKDDDQLLADCYRNCMQLAAECGVQSIAFPAISVGKFSFPKQKAMEMAMDTVLGWKHEHPENEMKVYFCCVDNRVFQCAKQALNERIGIY